MDFFYIAEFIAIKHNIFQANDLSFDLSSGGLMSGGLYANPTAQSTPVGASKRPGAAAAAGASSMLTTPNNSLLSMHNAGKQKKPDDMQNVTIVGSENNT